MKKMGITSMTSLEINESAEGQRIEDQVERLIENNEPLPADAPLIFSDRATGVEPEYNINTDRHEIVLDAMTVVEKTVKAKRQSKVEERKRALEELKANEVGDQSTNGNDGDTK